MAMSHPHGNVGSVTDVDRIESWSRLQGLMAVLALPPRLCKDGAYRRPQVEVEVAPDVWAPVENVWIDAEGMTFSYGMNGTATEYRFVGEACPRWRASGRSS